MTRQSAAIAVFVKTPGFSPIKTRLSAGLGSAKSEAFYRLSLQAIAATVGAVASSLGTSIYWAVAEKEALSDPLWSDISRIWQGTGGLGNRLEKVYRDLRARHDVVLFLGADAPQVQAAVLESALNRLANIRSPIAHVLGRCHDGGFYLVASRKELAPSVWTEVSYSTETAAQDLAQQLLTSGDLFELERLTDVDNVENLVGLRKELLATGDPTQQQLAILNWIDQGCPARSLDPQRSHSD